jgi:ATP-dependent exoDNAse (exonuclease V) beta subunit
MPALALKPKPTLLRRLPVGYVAPLFHPLGASAAGGSIPSDQTTPLYSRTEGGLQSRAFGTAIHALLEHLSRLRRTMDADQAALAVADFLPAIAATIRGSGLPRAAADRLAREALAVAREASTHPTGAWILTPHPESAAESRWTGLVTGLAQAAQANARPLSLRPDRVFYAPAMHQIDRDQGNPEPAWWIIDYKTSHPGAEFRDLATQQDFLRLHRQQHLEQLAAYAHILRGLRQHHAAEPLRIRAGIFYPRLHILDDWEA